MIAKLILLKKTNGHKSFMIRLSEKGKKSYRAVKAPFTVKEWNYDKQQLKGVRPDGSERYKSFIDNKTFVSDLEKKYTNQINKLLRLNKPFSFNKVFNLIDNPEQKSTTVHEVFKMRINELKEKEKYGTAANYKGTLGKLKSYHKQDILFNELDDVFLLKFKQTMISQGMSKATISIHLRNIRGVYNYAIQKRIAFKNDYPFINPDIMKELKTGYKSKAISKDEVDAIRELKEKLDEGTDLWHACNYFIFGYVGRGINFQDIARLKWKNRLQGRITYIRYKTRSKIDDVTTFKITPELSKILTWYRTHDVQLNNPYIFPILNGSHIKEVTKFNRIKKVRKEVNNDLNMISNLISAEIPITTYTWRHSFASIAKNTLKVDVSMISEMLGHHDLETTRHYLKQFPDDDKDNAVIGL
jgi:integrase/recombinase XerD